MNGYWNQLRPLEKRLVVGIGAVVFIVLNAWFVVPHFSDWGKAQRKMQAAQRDLKKYDTAIANIPRLKREIAELDDPGSEVIQQEEQATHFAATIQSQLIQSGVILRNTGKVQYSTNQNFYEVAQTIQVDGKEPQLVEFLFKLSDGNSLIRVRDLGLHPDPSRQMLSANVRLVGSYQRQMPVRGAATSSQAPAARSTSAPKTSTPTAAPRTTSVQTNKPGLRTTPGPSSPGTSKTAPASGKSAVPNPLKGGSPSRPGMTNKPANTKAS